MRVTAADVAALAPQIDQVSTEFVAALGDVEGRMSRLYK
jgi:hypothetical protein